MTSVFDLEAQKKKMKILEFWYKSQKGLQFIKLGENTNRGSRVLIWNLTL